jgi:hypothetical protein
MKKSRKLKSGFTPPPNAKSTDLTHLRASRLESPGHSEAQLHNKASIGRRTSAYVARIRPNILDFGDPEVRARLANSWKEMEAILTTKKIPRHEAKLAIAQTLNIANSHCLEPLRRAGDRDELERATSRLSSLIERINSFTRYVSELPSRSRGKLNCVLRKHDLPNFDSEIFASLVHGIINELSRVSPTAIADKASLALSDAFQASTNAVVVQISGSAPPKVVELWETIPPQTRVQVEAEVRCRRLHKSVVQFSRYLVTALKSSYPQATRGRPLVTERLFAQAVATVWRGLGLRPGRMYFAGDKDQPPSHRQSSFQRFCNLALEAVGNKSRVSSRQVVNLRRSLRQTS